MYEVPFFGLRAYSLFYSKYGSRGSFAQSEVDWSMGQSMKKKVFATLLNAGWLRKVSKREYACVNPDTIFQHLLDWRVPNRMKDAKKQYAFSGFSAVEIWSDFSYVQRGRERSPYFVTVAKKDLVYWKNFFQKIRIPQFIREGSTIGEFVILIPVDKVIAVEKDGFFVEPLKTTIRFAKGNELFEYSYNYMKKKYGDA